jgi:hypothetical protein
MNLREEVKRSLSCYGIEDETLLNKIVNRFEDVGYIEESSIIESDVWFYLKTNKLI